jgi:hypothetical protein
LVPLQILVLVVDRRRRPAEWLSVLPTAVLSTVYFALIFSARSSHLHFNDGTFSLSAPFWAVIFNSIARMMWIWGFAAAAVLFIFHRRSALLVGLLSTGWMIAGLLPYSFLTYMPRVPSRHTYLASAGLALLVGAAFSTLMRQSRSGVVAVAAGLLLCHNIGYLWVRKHAQYAERAAPTVELLRTLRSTDGVVTVECFPYGYEIALDLVRLELKEAPERRLSIRLQPGCSGYKYTVVDGPERPVAGFERSTLN